MRKASAHRVPLPKRFMRCEWVTRLAGVFWIVRVSEEGCKWVDSVSQKSLCGALETPVNKAYTHTLICLPECLSVCICV